MEPDANDIPCPDCGQPRPAGVRCPECGLPSEADAVAAVGTSVFRRLRRAIAMRQRVGFGHVPAHAVGCPPTRRVDFRYCLLGLRSWCLWRGHWPKMWKSLAHRFHPQKTDNTQRLSVCWGQLVDKEAASAKITRFRGFLGPQPQGVQ